jgi:signal peptidase II
MIFLVTVCAVLAADQLSKGLVRLLLSDGKTVHLAGDFLVLRQARNPGAAFGILKGAAWFFMLVSVLALAAAVVAYFLWARRSGRLYTVGLGLICAGTLGNIIDRAVFGKVIDFVEFNFWPTFNLADVAIVAGMAMLVIGLAREAASNPERGTDGSR